MALGFINSGLDFVLSPLFNLPALLAVAIVSVIISLIITLVYKLVTNQNLMKDLKNEIKELQSQIKQLKDRPSEAMKVQKRAMETNMKYMTHSFKPTLITFIPIILIFGWMGANFAYEPVKPGQDFEVSVLFDKNADGELEINAPLEMNVTGEKKKNVEDGRVSWILNGVEEGKYILEFNYNGEVQEKEVQITNGKRYSEKSKRIKDSKIKEISIGYKKLIIIPIGYKDWMGWLGTYIIFSLAFTMLFRKVMKVY